MTNLVVLLAIMFSELFAFGAKVLLKRGIDNQLLAYRVSSKFPYELIPVALLVIMVGWVVNYLVVVLLQLAVVLSDGG